MLIAVLVSLAWSCLAVGQGAPGLLPTETRIGTQPDGFGGETPIVTGQVFNHGAEAYRNVNIVVEAYDADGSLIGEGFGFLVDACGTALLDHALRPGSLQAFSATYELYDEAEAAKVVLTVDGLAEAPDWPPEIDATAATRITRGEVVMLEWLDDTTLIYGLGCDGDVFTQLDWWRYDLENHALTETEHPAATRVTAEMIERSGADLITQSGERNPALFHRSHMTFPPGARRIVYQNDLHTIFSAEPDGSFKRLIHDMLHRHSLRGFNWARQPGIFLAYYFGAYGESVRYFTAGVDGRMLMGRLDALEPSLITPGPADDGLAAVVGWRRGDVGGYYLNYAFGAAELLFEAELPGNNWPAPIVAGDLVYVIRPIAGIAALQCFNRRTRALTTVTALPLHLTREARAWSWLSPGGDALALAMNGTEGGLWLVDVAGGCA